MPFEHKCVAAGCKQWGCFGFNIDLRAGHSRTWYCEKHRHLGEPVQDDVAADVAPETKPKSRGRQLEFL